MDSDILKLIEQLGSGSEEAVEQARSSLAQRLDPHSVAPLVDVLHSATPRLRYEIVLTLGLIGGELAFQTLLSALHDKHPAVRQIAAYVLGVLKDPRAVQPLVMKFLDYDEAVRFEASRALREIGAPADDMLLRVIEANDPAIQAYAARALGRSANLRAVEPLLNLFYLYIDDAMPEVAHEAAYALAEIGTSRAVEPLLRVLVDVAQRSVADESDDTDVLARLKEASDMIGGHMVEPLTDLLDNPDAAVQEAAARLLGYLRDSRAVSWLIDKLDSHDPRVRVQAVLALGNIGDPRALEPLRDLLYDPRQQVRQAAQESLARIGER